MPSERGILMSGPMVRAILEGRKTQTRRPVKPQFSCLEHGRDCPDMIVEQMGPYANGEAPWTDGWTGYRHSPYGLPGDRLYVRETWTAVPTKGASLGDSIMGRRLTLRYRADGHGVDFESPALSYGRKYAIRVDIPAFDYPADKYGMWRPSIHMPKWAARLWLTVTEVRAERVQEISEEDAQAEGMDYHDGNGVGHSGWRHDRNHGYVYGDARTAFAHGWRSLYPGSWERNDWVWVYNFEVDR